MENDDGERIDNLRVALTHRGNAPAAPTQEIVQLKPTLWGMGVDLKALWRHWTNRAH